MLHSVAGGNLSIGEKGVAEGRSGVGKRRKANTEELSNLKTSAISDQQFVDSIEEVAENGPAAKRSRSLNFWSLEEVCIILLVCDRILKNCATCSHPCLYIFF